MAQEETPTLRMDLEFIPVNHQGRQMILIRDHLGLVQEGRAADPALFRLMALLDGCRSLRDIQMELMRQSGGTLVGTDEIRALVGTLDESYLLSSERFRQARSRMEEEFQSSQLRLCAMAGRSYPPEAADLKRMLDEILALSPSPAPEEGAVRAVVSPHIDPQAGAPVYASAYNSLRGRAPKRVVLLGIGHRMAKGLFSLTEKDFAMPLGTVRNESGRVRELLASGEGLLEPNDFSHRFEHSIEFQLLFLQHVLAAESFTIIPILCGSLQAGLTEYSRKAYLDKTGPFLETLRKIVQDPAQDTLVVAGVDFSHIGRKFGDSLTADQLASRAEGHDRRLLTHLASMDAESFWEESASVEDRYNVCGFAAMACLLEILPPCRATVLDYRMRHEQPTQSAVTFAAAVFRS